MSERHSSARSLRISSTDIVPCDHVFFSQDLYDAEQLCDVTLRVGEKDFKAHKIVLASSKSFLGTMMRSGMREADQHVIELKDISADQVHVSKIERLVRGAVHHSDAVCVLHV